MAEISMICVLVSLSELTCIAVIADDIDEVAPAKLPLSHVNPDSRGLNLIQFRDPI